ncbi:MAG: PIN domain-containing protein [Comamonadaceae bacterium]|nr:PIN domain-containing protein [Comamonadaceae bacterium]
MRPEIFAWPAASTPRALVLDTNIALDLLVFADPASAPLAPLLAARTLDWIGTAAMRAELACVLRYPQLAPRLAYHGLSDAAVLATWDAQVRLCPEAPRAPYVCKDADDQKFIDLAAAHAALLLSKDRAVLRLNKRLQRLGAQIATTLVPQG